MVLVLTVGASGTASSGEVPPDLKAAILFKVLGHDRSLAERSGDAVSIGLFWSRNDADSRQCRSDMGKVFGKLTAKKLGDLPIRFSEHSYTGVQSLESAISTNGIDVAFLCTGLEAKIGEVTGYSRANELVTLGDTETMVHDGVSVGVGLKGLTAKIIINQPAAEAEGMDLDPRLLIIAEVVN